MQNPEQAAADLAFVRQAIERRKVPPYAPLSLAILWAVIIMGGCVINDFVPRFAWMYWAIIPSIGFFLSWLMGAKHVLRMGEYDVAKGIRSGWHWGSLFLAAAPLWALGITGKVDGNTMGQLMFLVSGIYWFLGGLHLDRRFTLPGLAMILSACAMIFLHTYIWTISGVLVCIALVIGFGFSGAADER